MRSPSRLVLALLALLVAGGVLVLDPEETLRGGAPSCRGAWAKRHVRRRHKKHHRPRHRRKKHHQAPPPTEM
jgi:hypothetical protein